MATQKIKNLKCFDFKAFENYGADDQIQNSGELSLIIVNYI